ncbi:MAG: ankyrin repeat domain-containing protein [Planctomycetota bacterium]
MTYDRLYRVEHFRLINGVSHAGRPFGHYRASGRYESIQLCSGGWGQCDRPQGICGIGFGSDDHNHRFSYCADFLSTRFLYAQQVLTLSHQRTREHFPDWLDHQWIPVEPGWQQIQFTSPRRREAEETCARLVREIADSGEVTVTEQYWLELRDYMGRPVATVEESINCNCQYRRLWLVANVPEMDEPTGTSLREMIARGESFVPSTAQLRFGYEPIAPFFAFLDPFLLSLVNAEDGRPQATELDLELFKAVGRLDIELVLRLIDQGANVNALDKYGGTPFTDLATASRFDHLAFEEADEARKTQPDISQGERIAMMRQLLDRGADVNLFGFGGVNALTEAVMHCEDEVVCFLLSVGADPNHNQYPDDDPDDDSTPFFYAASDFSLAERGSLEEQKLERIYNALKDAGAAHNRSD